MILISDTSGFIGRVVARRLAENQRELRCLLRPSQAEQQLPRGIPCSTVSASMDDIPALRTAMQRVTNVLHLMGEDDPNPAAMRTHARHTASLVEAAREAGVCRLTYLSRLGADRTSAHALFRTRGEAEAIVRECGLDYTIIRAAITYGPEDAFTNMVTILAKVIPFAMPVPDSGRSRFQPLHVDDLATCIVDTLQRDDLLRQTVAIGGPEHFTLEQMVTQMLQVARVQKRLVRINAPLARIALWLLQVLLPGSPAPRRWLDVVAVGSATDLTSIPRHFGFEPARFADRLDYLRDDRSWRQNLARLVRRRR